MHDWQHVNCLHVRLVEQAHAEEEVPCRLGRSSRIHQRRRHVQHDARRAHLARVELAVLRSAASGTIAGGSSALTRQPHADTGAPANVVKVQQEERRWKPQAERPLLLCLLHEQAAQDATEGGELRGGPRLLRHKVVQVRNVLNKRGVADEQCNLQRA
ncbi:hypothetical protein DQ04_14691000 [Trypanosoma grayi]|uniref:hypothetical protein n=1 Tax=Trypanosoma grayi TaxID=71804 RepID=UPI0004F4A26F|nr:hypothetical protein DQ04_14691000 [Trypanosoma grayi]KEG06308.1 hypothetical protein DQ04_14691000 [Trypanosoma grayi]